MKNKIITIILFFMIPFLTFSQNEDWVSLFNGKNLDGWKIRGKATWTVENGVLIGQGKNGHIYASPELTDLEVKGTFRLSD